MSDKPEKYERIVRPEDRTRWTSMRFILDNGGAVAYPLLDEGQKRIVRETTSLIYRVANFKEPL